MKKLLMLGVIAGSIFSSTYTQATDYKNVDFAWDNTYSSDMGANLALSVMSLYQYLDDSAFPSTKHNVSLLSGASRLAKSFIIDANLARILMLVQHEYFGHGYRLREFSYPVTSYEFEFWPHGVDSFLSPLAGASGGTSYLINLNKSHPVYRSLIASGGVEANAQLAQKMRFRFENSQSMDARDFFLYLQSRYDLFDYIHTTSGTLEFFKGAVDAQIKSGHDIYRYVDSVNTMYDYLGYNNRGKLSAKKLRHESKYELLDPYLFFGMVGYYNYIVSGETQYDYPKIGTENFNVLPLMRLNLAPYGLEYQLDNYFNVYQYKFSAHMRYNNNPIKPAYGMSVRLANIYQYNDIWFSPHVAFWQQDAIFGTGGLLSLGIVKPISKEFSVFGEIGGKTGGYMPGYDIQSAVIFKAGLRLGF